MLFSNITIIDESFLLKTNVCVGVKNGKIDYIGSYKEGYGEVFDGSGYLLVPALCSAHSHTTMTLLRGAGSDLPLERWLNEAIFPKEAMLTDRDYYNGTLCGCAEMIKYGVVSCNDMYYRPLTLVKAYSDAGIKANISVATTCFDPNMKFADLPAGIEAEEAFEAFGGNKGKVRLDCSVHAVYTNTLASVEGVINMAKAHNAGIHVHVSETETEHKECIEKYGMTPTQLFDKMGMFDVRTIAAHCVQCTDTDYEIMAEKDVFMASCPTSNLKLGSGIPDYSRVLGKGVKVCLGTDGVASNNNLNMIKEAKLMALLAKGITRDASACKTSCVIEACTRNGWLSQGRENSGLIKEGMDADLAVFDLSKVNTRPSPDAADTLIYACDGEAYMTVCDGEILYKNGVYYTIDTEKLVYEMGE